MSNYDDIETMISSRDVEPLLVSSVKRVVPGAAINGGPSRSTNLSRGRGKGMGYRAMHQGAWPVPHHTTQIQHHPPPFAPDLSKHVSPVGQEILSDPLAEAFSPLAQKLDPLAKVFNPPVVRNNDSESCPESMNVSSPDGIILLPHPRGRIDVQKDDEIPEPPSDSVQAQFILMERQFSNTSYQIWNLLIALESWMCIKPADAIPSIGFSTKKRAKKLLATLFEPKNQSFLCGPALFVGGAPSGIRNDWCAQADHLIERGARTHSDYIAVDFTADGRAVTFQSGSAPETIFVQMKMSEFLSKEPTTEYDMRSSTVFLDASGVDCLEWTLCLNTASDLVSPGGGLVFVLPRVYDALNRAAAFRVAQQYGAVKVTPSELDHTSSITFWCQGKGQHLKRFQELKLTMSVEYVSNQLSVNRLFKILPQLGEASCQSEHLTSSSLSGWMFSPNALAPQGPLSTQISLIPMAKGPPNYITLQRFLNKYRKVWTREGNPLKTFLTPEVQESLNRGYLFPPSELNQALRHLVHWVKEQRTIPKK